MKNNEVKSFTFKVAQNTEANKKQWKANEGVTVACSESGGCTNTQFWWGIEPTWNFDGCFPGDGGVFC